jgi:hypothetical protein
MTLTAEFVFSQNNLQDFVDCPRRFQLKYILKTAWPAPISEPIAEHDRLISLGSQFHMMAQRFFLGIPETVISKHVTDEDLLAWWNTFISNPPSDMPPMRQPEVSLSMPFAGYRLAAKIDLLAMEPGVNAVIYDWKTTHQEPKPRFLTERIQSLVYPLLVITTGGAMNGYKPFDPEQVSMVYWYPAFPDKPVRLAFDAAWVIGATARLNRLVSQIIDMKQEIFPLTVDAAKCKFCRYRSLCESGTTAGNLEQEEDETPQEESLMDINFDDIQEIAF